MNFNFEAKGFDVSGDVQIYNNKLILKSELPFFAAFFKEKIESTIKNKLGEVFY